MDALDAWRAELAARPRRWLVTGAAGFIGSHLVAELLESGQEVRGLDDLSTGFRANLDEVRAQVGESAWGRFAFTVGDVRDRELCHDQCAGIDFVLHQAALGSVPRSLVDPIATHGANVEGFLSVLEATRATKGARFVFASSSSVYGDSSVLPRREEEIGNPLSPYAATKRIDELYARVYHECFDVPTVGLRYFNVFGRRQDPHGPYAAVLPRWIDAFAKGERPVIHGDGTTTRDFCPVANVVAANLLAAGAGNDALGRVFNIGLGTSVDLSTAFARVRDALVELGVDCADFAPRHENARPGDVRHSLADTDLARDVLGYEPRVGFVEGLRESAAWFLSDRGAQSGR